MIGVKYNQKYKSGEIQMTTAMIMPQSEMSAEAVKVFTDEVKSKCGKTIEYNALPSDVALFDIVVFVGGNDIKSVITLLGKSWNGAFYTVRKILNSEGGYISAVAFIRENDETNYLLKEFSSRIR